MLSLVITTIILTLLTICSSIYALDFLYNSFTPTATLQLNLTNDAHLEPPVIRLTKDSNPFSLGHAFHPAAIRFKNPNSSAITTSFSTQFIFSVLPETSSSPGFGLAFVLAPSTSPPEALSGQYFGLFSTTISSPPSRQLLVIEFDTGRTPEASDPDDNHVGIDFDSIISRFTRWAGYVDNGSFVPFSMRNGENVHAWIEFDGPRNELNVSIAPVGVGRPSNQLINFRDPVIADYVSDEMFVGFSASRTDSVEAQRVLAWSFSDTGIARDINTTNLPIFQLGDSSSNLENGTIAGIVVVCVVFVLGVGLFGFYWFWWRKRGRGRDDDVVEDWELEFWPHRFSYEELFQATNGFPKNELLGSGGFGKVYKGKLENNVEVAVKCVNSDSKQGLKEFMAEISSMGRLQHKNLVRMRGWCRRMKELMLVYDYMPNGSLNRWIFDNPEKLMGWEGRRRVLADVAEGLNYLHHGWDQFVLHRDIKSSNVLLDSDMRGRLGDFGLAKLYTHGEIPNATRVVGTFGYLAPEVAKMAIATAASDVYSFGVVVLEVACGRKPIDTSVENEDDEYLIDWVRQKYAVGKLVEAADKRINGQFEVEEMEAVLKLGLSCCHPDPLRRPSMREVVAFLVRKDVAAVSKDLLSELVQENQIS